MTNKQLSQYYGVTISAVDKWSAETKRRKTIEAQSGANPQIRKLIGEISELCYISNCQGNLAVFTSGSDTYTFSQQLGTFDKQQLTIENLTAVKQLLIKTVYGE